MKESFYFPHDTDAHSDPKIMELIGTTGLAGLGFYWLIIEILHQQKDGKITESAFKQYLNFYLRPENRGSELLTSVEQVLNTTRLLLKDESGMIYSERVLANKKYRNEISEKRSFAGKKSAASRSSSTHVEQNRTSVEQGKEIKGNKRKGNKKKYSHEESGELCSPTPAQTMRDFILMVSEKNERYESFLSTVTTSKNLSEDIVRRELDKFADYWGELTKDGKRQRWELEKTFEVPKRLGNWFSRINNFSQKTSQGQGAFIS